MNRLTATSKLIKSVDTIMTELIHMGEYKKAAMLYWTTVKFTVHQTHMARLDRRTVKLTKKMYDVLDECQIASFKHELEKTL